MAYTKLFSSIITSTIWTEDDRTRIVWITMLACADKNGEIQASIPGLARIAGVPVEDCRLAVARFLAPDPDSRTKDDEGRRIEEIDGGWSLINYRKYREMATEEDRKLQAAIRQQRVRDKKSRNRHAEVTQGSRQISQAEAKAHTTERETPAAGGTLSRLVSLEDAKMSRLAPADCTRAWWHDHEARGWIDKHGQPVRNWRASLTAFAQRWQANERPPPAPNGNRPRKSDKTPIARVVDKFVPLPVVPQEQRVSPADVAALRKQIL